MLMRDLFPLANLLIFIFDIVSAFVANKPHTGEVGVKSPILNISNASNSCVSLLNTTALVWLGGRVVRTLDLRSTGRD